MYRVSYYLTDWVPLGGIVTAFVYRYDAEGTIQNVPFTFSCYQAACVALTAGYLMGYFCRCLS